MASNKRIHVGCNKVGQPIGEKATKLNNFLGTLARNGRYVPITYNDWRAVKPHYKEDLWSIVLSKFDIEETLKKWVMKSIGRKWKNWKIELKETRYTPHDTDKERLMDIDDRVVPDQWPAMVSFWSSQEYQERCAINKASYKKQKICHTMGTKSFARVREEERAKRPNGEEPTRAEIFIITHTRKNGRPVDEASLNIISKLQEATSQQQEMSQDHDGTVDILSQVMGAERHGHVRTYGLGPSPNDIWGPKPNRFESQRIANDDVRMMREKIENMEQYMKNMQEGYALLKAELDAMKSAQCTRQIPDASSDPETSSNQHILHSSSSSHQVPLPEVQLKKTQDVRGKNVVDRNVPLKTVFDQTSTPKPKQTHDVRSKNIIEKNVHLNTTFAQTHDVLRKKAFDKNKHLNTSFDQAHNAREKNTVKKSAHLTTAFDQVIDAQEKNIVKKKAQLTTALDQVHDVRRKSPVEKNKSLSTAFDQSKNAFDKNKHLKTTFVQTHAVQENSATEKNKHINTAFDHVHVREINIVDKNKHLTTTLNKAGLKVILMSFRMSQYAVARGTLVSDEPSRKVGGIELGPEFSEVYVEVPLMWKEPLPRPHGCYKTIGDAIGATIAWPSSRVQVTTDT